MKCEALQKFRQQAYELLGKAQDATFELIDAVMTTPKAKCLGDFSLSPLFRRQWSSVYETLQDALPDREQLMQLYIKQMSQVERPVLAVDHTLWNRPHAPTLKERTYEHQPSAIPGNTPVGIGFGYSTIAWIPEAQGSWALPLRHERITSWDTPIAKAAWQIEQVLEHLPQRPLVLFDREYGCATLVLQTAQLKADKLMRLRSNRCLYSAPPPYSGRGRPRSHGKKFQLNDPQTWWADDQSVELDDAQLGRLRVRQWHNLHFGASATHPMTLILLERLDIGSNQHQAKPLWLAWIGENLPQLKEIWQQYLRRFAIDHWYRLAKQTLHWTLPQLSTPEQCDRWSDLMPLLTWQLWLARDLVRDYHLPWQKPVTNLTPGRAAQSIFPLLVKIGTPAAAPKRRGKSPGWPIGLPRTPKTRYPLVKKGKGRFQKHRQVAS
jgi:hypothetical protein